MYSDGFEHVFRWTPNMYWDGPGKCIQMTTKMDLDEFKDVERKDDPPTPLGKNHVRSIDFETVLEAMLASSGLKNRSKKGSKAMFEN
eukprot:6016332-Karenia_brevis.AAC.1